MRKLIAALALSTTALAVTSIYLWTELRDARGQVESFSRAEAATPMPLAGATRPQDDAHPVASSGAPPTAAADSTSSPDDVAKTRQKLFEDEYRDAARRRLAQLSDPTMRAQLLEEWKEANLPNKPKYA